MTHGSPRKLQVVLKSLYSQIRRGRPSHISKHRKESLRLIDGEDTVLDSYPSVRPEQRTHERHRSTAQQTLEARQAVRSASVSAPGHHRYL